MSAAVYAVAPAAADDPANTGRTRVAIVDSRWQLNSKPVHAGTPAEGLLLNLRVLNCVFEDLRRAEFDAGANASEFIARIPDYVANGVRAFTISLQGGYAGYRGAVNSAFHSDGTHARDAQSALPLSFRCVEDDAVVYAEFRRLTSQVTEIERNIMSSDYEKGYAQFARMVGEENIEQLTARFKLVCPDFETEVISFVGGRIWTRAGIDLKTRSLCSICVLAALGRNNALRLNLQMALRNGASLEEICEAIFQVAAYAGFAAAWDALEKLQEVLADEHGTDEANATE